MSELVFNSDAVLRKHGASIQEIPLNKIKLSRNSRMNIRDEELAGLMQSIKEEGLLQPIGVVKSGNGYEIAYGNRRFLACSKLGLSRIPAIIHDTANANDIDIKNLAENIQRRNISLQEAGRYMIYLRDQDIKVGEIAVRLGVSEGYVRTCIDAYHDVPAEFRDDLVVQTTNEKVPQGKISITTARSILTAAKTMRLSKADAKKLFKSARDDDDFKADNIMKYAAAIKAGRDMKRVHSVKRVMVSLVMTEAMYNELYEKYVVDGPYRSVSGVLTAKIKGEINPRVELAR